MRTRRKETRACAYLVHECKQAFSIVSSSLFEEIARDILEVTRVAQRLRDILEVTRVAQRLCDILEVTRVAQRLCLGTVCQ
jgi:hypothetical protein